MGMALDMRRRVTRERTDELRRRQRVDEARKLIFQLGAPVDGSRVQTILNEESYVPVRVSAAAIYRFIFTYLCLKLERILYAISRSWCQHVFAFCS
jgi:hypothetical protein